MMAVFIAGALLIVAMGWFIGTATRSMARQFEQRGRSIDQDMVEARLYRIEEAIDAMAVQIERLSHQQQQLLGAPPAPGPLPDEPPAGRRA